MTKNRNLISKGVIFIQLLLLICLLTGCENHVQSTDVFNIFSSQGSFFQELSTDQSAYLPNEVATLTIIFNPFDTSQEEMTLLIRLTHLTEILFESTSLVSTGGLTSHEVEVTIPLPDDDYIGYAIEVYLLQNHACIDYDMIAIDVSSTWNVFPRYGYLTKYDYETISEAEQVLFELNQYHLNGLMYYDVIDQHDKPLAGSTSQPDLFWKTINQSTASKLIIEALIETGKTFHMNSYVYTLFMGAYDQYESQEISEEWGLYKDFQHLVQDYHPLPMSWETSKLYLFNPGNSEWQDYYIQQMQDFLLVYLFDGLQVDSLGNRGLLYDYEGNVIYLNKLYTDLLSRLKTELNTSVIFNPVSGYGLSETISTNDNDIIYMEIWDGTYYSIQRTLYDIYDTTQGEIGTVLSAYMNYGNETGYFNEPSVLYTNATIISSGGSHLEMGDNGMLSKEYYPGTMLNATVGLLEKTKQYYNFEVAYENYLRGPGLSLSNNQTFIDGNEQSSYGQAGKIWTFSKMKNDTIEIVHFINLLNVEDTEWVDASRTKAYPSVLSNVEVKRYVNDYPEHVFFASPDEFQALMFELEFQTGTDELGSYITFVLPSLEYYSMVVIQSNSVH